MFKSYELNRLTGWFNGELDTMRTDLFQALNGPTQTSADDLNVALLKSLDDLRESVDLIYQEMQKLGGKK